MEQNYTFKLFSDFSKIAPNANWSRNYFRIAARKKLQSADYFEYCVLEMDAAEIKFLSDFRFRLS